MITSLSLWKRISLFFSFLLCLSINISNAQVIINEIIPAQNAIEFKNSGDSFADLRDYWVYNHPNFARLLDLEIVCGSLMLGPGEIVTVGGLDLNSADGELGLYLRNVFGSRSAIQDYVEWGSPGHLRSATADSAGIWQAGTFVPSFGGGQSLAFDGEGNTPADWFASDPSICLNNNGEDEPCNVNAGSILTRDPTEICAGDSIPDPIMVWMPGSFGTVSGWIITDSVGNILSLPTTPPFDFEGAGPGKCLIWHIRSTGIVEGLEVGKNANQLQGCFDLSNAVVVTRLSGGDCSVLCMAEGGTITTTDPTETCAGDGTADVINVSLEGNSGTNSAWVITDMDGAILDLPSSPPFDFEGAGPGTCLIWHLSFEDGLTGADIGSNANDLQGCFSLSNPITVTRNSVEGGVISTMNNTSFCAGDGIADSVNVALEGNIGSNSAWVITDTAGVILDLPSGPPFDFEGAGPGICLIWHLSFEDGLTGADIGSNANDLQGCFDLSNSITITRNGPEGGTISTMDNTNVCAGDSIPDLINVSLIGNIGTNSAWVITDSTGVILDLPSGPPFNFEGAGPGICLIWHLSFEDGLIGAVVDSNANNLQGCFSLSNPITINRFEGADCDANCTANGGIIASDSPLEICAGDGVPDSVDVVLESALGTNSAWVITDEDGNILDLPAAPPFDFEGAGAGVCLIWHLSFEDGLTGADVGANAADLQGCFDLSNPITVTRTGVDGGMVSTSEGDSTLAICVGDGDADIINFATTSTSENYQFIVTDTANVILALPDAASLDFEGSGVGVCRVWGVAFSGNIIAQVGDTASMVRLSNDCFSLSSNFITVSRDTTGASCVIGIRQVPVEPNMTAEIAPNPITDNLNLTLDFKTLTDNVIKVRIINTSGFQFHNYTDRVFENSNQLELDISNLLPGVYILSIRNGREVVNTRFIKVE